MYLQNWGSVIIKAGPNIISANTCSQMCIWQYVRNRETLHFAQGTSLDWVDRHALRYRQTWLCSSLQYAEGAWVFPQYHFLTWKAPCGCSLPCCENIMCSSLIYIQPPMEKVTPPPAISSGENSHGEDLNPLWILQSQVYHVVRPLLVLPLY